MELIIIVTMLSVLLCLPNLAFYVPLPSAVRAYSFLWNHTLPRKLHVFSFLFLLSCFSDFSQLPSTIPNHCHVLLSVTAVPTSRTKTCICFPLLYHMTNLDSILKSRDITLPTKVHTVRVTVFPIVSYGCEGWTTKKAEHRRIDAFELWCWRRLLRVPWTAGRSNQSIPKENQPWIFIRRTDGEAETPILWPLDGKSRLTGKDPDARKNRGQKEEGTTEDEMVGWHHQLNGHEFEWTPGVGDGQGGLVCCSPWGRKELNTT